jgi:thiamine-phosphate pyrophosphorylase
MKYFYFSSNLNYQDNLLRYKDKSIIIYNDNYKDKNFINEKNLISLRKFCKNKKIKFYIMNDIKFAFRYKADGLIIASNNKRPIYNFNKRILKIGIVHTQWEYYEKKQQKCDYIFLSPIFLNKKYSVNNILGILKFNLISLNWKIKILALGGISEKNIKKIRLTRSDGIGAITFFKKKGPLQIL